MLSADGGSHAPQTTEAKEQSAAAAASRPRPLLGRQLRTLQADTTRTPGLRVFGVRTVTVLRADALRAVPAGPATPTEDVSSLAQLFIASWIRTRT